MSSAVDPARAHRFHPQAPTRAGPAPGPRPSSSCPVHHLLSARTIWSRVGTVRATIGCSSASDSSWQASCPLPHPASLKPKRSSARVRSSRHQTNGRSPGGARSFDPPRSSLACSFVLLGFALFLAGVPSCASANPTLFRPSLGFSLCRHAPISFSPPTSFQRLLVYRCAQYLGLITSGDGPNGKTILVRGVIPSPGSPT